MVMSRMMYKIAVIFLIFNRYLSSSNRQKSYYLNEPRACPGNQFEWERREMIFNCRGLTYHCIKDLDGKLWEACLEARPITRGDCPVIVDIDGEPEFMESPYSPCSSTDPRCPQWPYNYPSNEMYRYPACIENVDLPTTTPPLPYNKSSIRPYIQVRDARPHQESNASSIIVAVVVGFICGAVVILIILLAYFLIRRHIRRRKNQTDASSGNIDEERQFMISQNYDCNGMNDDNSDEENDEVKQPILTKWNRYKGPKRKRYYSESDANDQYREGNDKPLLTCDTRKRLGAEDNRT